MTDLIKTKKMTVDRWQVAYLVLQMTGDWWEVTFIPWQLTVDRCHINVNLDRCHLTNNSNDKLEVGDYEILA